MGHNHKVYLIDHSFRRGLLFLSAYAHENLDQAFGTNGIVITPFDHAHSGTFNKVVPTIHLKIQPDGKIVVVGDVYKIHGSQSAKSAVGVVRYNTDGSLDQTFGNKGTVTVNIGRFSSYGCDLDLQQDGKIVIAARSWDRDGGLPDGAIIRLHADGQLDHSFGEHGFVVDANAYNNWSNFFRIKVQDDGKIVVAGNQGTSLVHANDHEWLTSTFYAARYNADGTADPSFGNTGKVRTVAKTSEHEKPGSDAYSLALQADGKIIVIGLSENILSDGLIVSSGTCGAMVRYNQDGTLDRSFGADQNGIVINAIDTDYASHVFTDVMVQDDQRIIVIGKAHNAATDNDELLIARYTKDGLLDNSFGKNNTGIVTMPVGTGTLHAKNGAIQKDGKILVTGVAQCGNNKKFTVICFTQDGIVDNTFGLSNNGIITTAVRDDDDKSFAIALPDDSKILIAGDSFNSAYFDFALIRYRKR